MKKNLIILTVSILTGIGIFIYVIHKVGPGRIIDALSLFPVYGLLLVFGLVTLINFLACYKWKLILKTQGHNISWGEIIMAKLIGNSISYLTPIIYLGGEPLRAYILKRESNIPMSQGLASIFIDKGLDLSYGLLFLITGAVFLLIKFVVPPQYVFLLLAMLFVVMSLSFLFFYRGFRGRGFFYSVIKSLGLGRIKRVGSVRGEIDEMDRQMTIFFQKQKKTLLSALVISLTMGFLNVFQFWLIISLLGFKINLLGAFFIISLTAIVYLIPIPGSLGTYETGGALIFALMGLGANVGIALSLIVRLMNLIVVAFGLGFLLHFGIKISQVFLWQQKLAKNNNGEYTVEKINKNNYE